MYGLSYIYYIEDHYRTEQLVAVASSEDLLLARLSEDFEERHFTDSVKAKLASCASDLAAINAVLGDSGKYTIDKVEFLG